ncbi:hypothetical protein [Pseudonocardia parietis]|uniref:Uncharacterized protein n=1 Tax=Pseudonocardia parietis TaxID=570936 RepID=A0ABS4VX58_9PSEU|nr:hypothetical protein [Pseudonocardia parietis]MBP2368525.1 hypothetical protein [Pseudonocardia parietis]
MDSRAIHLEIRLDGESPVGRAYDERGGTREFAGWMGLVAVIDDLLGASPPGSTPSPPDGRTGP